MSALQGVRVLDGTHGQAGAYAGALLADLGAEVVRHPGVGCLLRGRTCLDDDPDALWATLAPHADVLLWDGPRAPLGAVAPWQIFCHLPPFAPGEPPAPGRPGHPEAWMGLYAPPVGARPAVHHLGLLPLTAALYALNGVLAALLAREESGLGQEVRCVEADAAYPLLELNALFTLSPPRRWATLPWAATPFIGPWRAARGGWIYVHLGLRAHLARFLDAADALAPAEAARLRRVLSPAVLAEPTSVGSGLEQLRLRRALRALFLRLEAPRWEEALSDAGLCAVEVRPPTTWRDSPHARASRQVVELDGRLAPGAALTLSATPALPRPAAPADRQDVLRRWRAAPRPARRAAPPPHPLHNLRVLDLTQVIAGPTAARTLAELGATVHRVENPRFDAPWVEAFHIAFNTGKSSETINLNSSAGRARFWELVEELRPDVVLQNLRPGAAEALGIGEADVRARLPEVIYAHLTAWGEEGPWAPRPGWEQTAQAACGVQAVWGGDAGPSLFPLPFNDLGTGLLGALGIQAALWARRRGLAGGQRVGACLSATATWMQAATLFDGALQPWGASSLGAWPGRRAYRLADGWAFLEAAPATLRDLHRVEGLAACGAASGGPALGAALEAALATAPLATWRARLDAAALGEAVALTPWRTWRAALLDPRAAQRGLVHRRHHDGIGEVTETGSPLRLQGTPLVKTAPAPRRGEADVGALSAPSWIHAQARGALGLLLRRWS